MTRGDVIIEEIKIGDIHYEFDYGCVCVSKVISKPVLKDGVYSWESENTLTGEVIKYAQNTKYPHYGLKLYTHMAYCGCTQI